MAYLWSKSMPVFHHTTSQWIMQQATQSCAQHNRALLSHSSYCTVRRDTIFVASHQFWCGPFQSNTGLLVHKHNWHVAVIAAFNMPLISLFSVAHKHSVIVYVSIWISPVLPTWSVCARRQDKSSLVTENYRRLATAGIQANRLRLALQC